MLAIPGPRVRLCDGISRRAALRIGSLASTGLLWSDLLRARAADTRVKSKANAPSAKACILIYNYGGPSHLDTWDLKPDATSEIRGEFKPIATRVPGIAITEHLPRLAAMADRYAIVRSVGHRDNDHAIGAYLTLTGHSHPKHEILGIEPPATPQDMPSLGAVVSKLRPVKKPLFSYVTLGDLRHLGNNDSMGQNAGCLGKAYDPFTLPFVRPIEGPLDMSGITSVLGAVDRPRLDDRRRLLDEMAHVAPGLEATANLRHLDDAVRKAHELLASSASRDAFDLAKEPQKVRDSYGPSPFSQSCLLARRLVEAGIPMITVYSWGNRDWDTHSKNFQHLKNTLLPGTDRAVTALLDDLRLRGLLDDTLVVWMGDMGRTPRINKEAGRDHWSFCYSVVMAGGGVRGGQVLGSSDRSAAYPATNPVVPADVTATIYRCLGIDPTAHVTDQQGRPIGICPGKPIEALLG
ncbi:hypothetical protein AYO44_09580 [Planctomycetaceae bacterium SCGC AG-212-F19]|nr:hypothetical protein AYO44_09580 [Planctomycetaceae bacterium SCGC AG-212-F19]